MEEKSQRLQPFILERIFPDYKNVITAREVNNLYYFKYNNVDLSDIAYIKEVEMPSLPTMSHSSIEMFERDGSVYNGMSYEARSIRLTFVIKKDNADDYETAVRDVKNTFAI